MVPDSTDLDKRLTSLEEQLREAGARQQLGNVLSFGLLGFAVFQWWTRPKPGVRVYYVRDEDVPPLENAEA